ncbi:hypothetical protein [Hymenobacter koreensis]|uniref:T9SS type A sorting domain-containing protein n=1 Tax=Hymenobacter koreensis TaxID=1084523 RepID=A0ABP8IUN9_9BACT
MEQSPDGRRWQQVGFVPCQGTSSSPHTYAFALPGAGAAYYRLVQQDTDGVETRSAARFVAGSAAAALQLYPNPARATAELPGTLATAEVQLLSLQGSVMRRYPAGTTQLDLRGLAADPYLVRVGAQVARLVVE